MEIREIKVDDYIQVAHLNKQLGYNFPKNKVKERIEKISTCTKDKILVAVDKNDLAIGFIHATPYELLYYESIVNILGLVVDEQYRKKGVGKRLLKAIEQWAKSNDYTGVRINTGLSRTEAHKFYRSCEYISNKEQKRFFKSF